MLVTTDHYDDQLDNDRKTDRQKRSNSFQMISLESIYRQRYFSTQIYLISTINYNVT